MPGIAGCPPLMCYVPDKAQGKGCGPSPESRKDSFLLFAGDLHTGLIFLVVHNHSHIIDTL